MKYAGETLEVSVAAEDFDQETPLDDSDVVSMKVTIIGPAGELVVDDDTMDFETPRWVYLWDTPEVAGLYNLKITALDVLGHDSVEWQTQRLSPPRAVVVA